MNRSNGPSDLGVVFLAEARERIEDSVRLIQHCVDQLDDAQLWTRPGNDLNSIANLLLHLSGNLQQRFQADVGGEPDVRDRFGEFTDRSEAPKAVLQARFQEAVSTALARLDELGANDLAELRPTTRLAGRVEKPALAILFQTLTHLAGHAQEIVFITRLHLGGRYRYRNPDGVPPGMRRPAVTKAEE